MNLNSKHPNFKNVKTLIRKNYLCQVVRSPTKAIRSFRQSKPKLQVVEQNNFLPRARKLVSLTMKNLVTQSKEILKIKSTNFHLTTLRLKKNLLCNSLSKLPTNKQLSPCLTFPWRMKNLVRPNLIQNKKLNHKQLITQLNRISKSYFRHTQSQKTIFYYSR